MANPPRFSKFFFRQAKLANVGVPTSGSATGQLPTANASARAWSAMDSASVFVRDACTTGNGLSAPEKVRIRRHFVGGPLPLRCGSVGGSLMAVRCSSWMTITTVRAICAKHSCADSASLIERPPEQAPDLRGWVTLGPRGIRRPLTSSTKCVRVLVGGQRNRGGGAADPQREWGNRATRRPVRQPVRRSAMLQ